MTSQQAKALARWYREQLREGVRIGKLGGAPTYVFEMIDRMQLIDESKTEKLMRWLGFVQGVLYAAGIYNVEELKRHSRQISEDAWPLFNG